MKDNNRMWEGWSYCWRVMDKDTVVCKLCHGQVPDTVGIWRHLRKEHRDAYHRTRHYKHRIGVRDEQNILPMNDRPEHLGSPLLLCDLQRKNWSDLGSFDEKHLRVIKLLPGEESGPNAAMGSDSHGVPTGEKCTSETSSQRAAVIAESSSTVEADEQYVIADFEIVVERFSLEDVTLNSGPPTNDAEESKNQLVAKHCGAKAKGHFRHADDGGDKGERKRPTLNKKRTHKHCKREETTTTSSSSL